MSGENPAPSHAAGSGGDNEDPPPADGTTGRGEVPQVVLRFAPLPEHVRTARLVAVAMARRSGVEEGLLDEVRLAVGEACSRAVGLHRGTAPHTPVEVRLEEGRDRFAVEVLDIVSGGPVPKPDEPGREGDGDADEAFGDDNGAQMGLAVLRGLVDDLDVRLTARGGVIRMTWPVAGPRLAV